MLEPYKQYRQNKTFLDRFPDIIFNQMCLYKSIVLDIGAGFCNDSKWATAHSVEQYINLDIEKFAGLNVIGNGAYLPFKNKSIDIVVLNNVLHCLIEPKVVINVLKESHRLCRGILIGRTISDVLNNIEPSNEFEKLTLEAIKSGKLVGISRHELLRMSGIAGFNSCTTIIKKDKKPWSVYYFRMEVI
jgi:hypothetical protein